MTDIRGESGGEMDSSALLARELRSRLEEAARRAAFVRRWNKEHPGQHCCGVLGDGTPEDPYIIID